MVYSATLERWHTARYREFKSHRLRRMKKYLFAVLVLVAVAVLAYVVLPKEVDTTVMRTITIGVVSVAVEVADTESLRERGLSGRSDLRSGNGMLFVFDTDGLWNIWMKDMRFPIDIVWADVDGKVVTVALDIAPETYPEVFSPSSPARYVLELPAGFAAAHGIVEGGQIML